MLRSGRKPRSKSQQIILDNCHAMALVRERLDQDLTPALDDPAAAGRLQRADDDRVAVHDERGRVLFEPPPAEQLPQRLEALCAFANPALDEEDVQPVMRAIVVHCWLGHDHPFEDGNGRTARLLFYWTLLREGYWLAEYLSISSILKRAPVKHARSFLYSAWDERDVTYFALYQLSALVRASEQFQDYLQRKSGRSATSSACSVACP